MFYRVFLALFLISMLTACASIESSKLNQEPLSGGLNYFLPKRGLIITIDVTDPASPVKKEIQDLRVQAKTAKKLAATEGDAAKKAKFLAEAKAKDERANVLADEIVSTNLKTTAVASMSAMYPDYKSGYSLTYRANLVGKNKLDIGINERGLLQSSNSKTESKITEVLSNIASSVGSGIAFAANAADQQKPNCGKVGQYVFTFPISSMEKTDICSNKVTLQISKLFGTAIQNAPKEGNSVIETGNGIFYRQNLPYLVELAVDGVETKSLVLSPSESPDHFLPIHQTLFADNEATFTFKDGIPTKYVQESDGELVAFFKIPADIIGAYFKVAGDVFSAFKTNNDNEIAALETSINLLLAKQKTENCLAAINAKDQERIAALGCSTSE